MAVSVVLFDGILPVAIALDGRELIRSGAKFCASKSAFSNSGRIGAFGTYTPKNHPSHRIVLGVKTLQIPLSIKRDR